MNTSFRRTRLACFYSYLSMSSIFCLPALLFVTFRNTYGISYTKLGSLVLINFVTQFGIDLIFTFFAKYFNIKKTVSIMPFLTSAGLFAYALLPMLMPAHVYLGLVIGTVLFSVSAGLSEVLLSPIVAAMPSDHPDRDMSMLHSLYAWGLVLMILITTTFLRIFGTANWQYLTMILAILPLGAGILFLTSPIPAMDLSGNNVKSAASKQTKGIVLCVLCIFLGSAAENVMTNWISGFMENGLRISKDVCDVVGMAVFAAALGLTRTLYGKFGKNIINTLTIGMIGASVCYLTAALSPNVVVAVIACILTGALTAMLWPGTLIMMEENMPALGVAAYALMAAGGDFGAAAAPQLLGIIADKAAASAWAQKRALEVGLSTDQIGLKVGMLAAAAFPILGTILLFVIRGVFKKKKAD